MGESQTRVSVRMPSAYVKALEKAAAREERTVSQEIRRLVRHHIEQGPERVRMG